MTKTFNNIEIPESYQGIFSKAKKSRTFAVKANCIACSGFQLNIARDCGVPDCPLFSHNPYRKLKLKREGA